MDDGKPPYREPAERPPTPQADRRWLTRTPDDVVKGPYSTEAMQRSIQSGGLKPTTLVRLEDEADWRPVADVAELWSSGALPRPESAPYRQPQYPPPDNREAFAAMTAGSFGGGFCAGFFGGCIGLVIVLSMSSTGSETKRGAKIGFVVQMVVGVVVRIAIMASQH